MVQRLFVLVVFSLFFRLYSQTEDRRWLNHVDVAAVAGTSGLGFDLGISVNEHLTVRTGFTYMPRFSVPIDIQVSLEDGFEEVQYGSSMKEQNKKLKQLLGMLNDFTGLDCDNKVSIDVTPTFYNGKILVDWYPFHTKSWHFTTGVYFGPSLFGTAVNYSDETAFLLAINAYNTMYGHVMAQEDLINVGGKGFEVTPEMYEKFENFGRITFYIGPENDGSYYHTVPLADGTVHADCYVNVFKPYLGFGYGRSFGTSGRCTLSVESGCMFWGGSPRIITHDGVDLARDMEYIKKGTLRHLVDGISALKVFPLLEARLSWRIF